MHSLRLRVRALSWGALALLTAFLTGPSAARAQDGTAIDQFDPAPPGDGGFVVQSPDAPGDRLLRLGVGLDWVHESLVLRRTDGDGDVGAVISDQLWLRLQGSFSLADRYLLTLALPAAVAQAGDDPSDPTSGLSAASPDGFELGDLRLGGRVRLLGPARGGVQLAVGAHLWLPTGASDSVVSDGAVRAMPFAVLGGEAGRLGWSSQLGVMLRRGGRLPGDTATPVGTAVTFGAGIGYYVDARRHLRIGPELYGQTVVVEGGSLLSEKSTNTELLAGARYRPGGGDYRLGLGAGPGIGRGAGTPAFRVVATFELAPEPSQERTDRDRDGVFDDEDACPDVAGVSTGDPRTDGCPPDRDGDGVPDARDACPDVAGEDTADPATRGCPLDRDGDTVPDGEDACPDTPGDPTPGVPQRGCPPPVDEDGDGIADGDDACPSVAGVPSDDPKKHGCPPDRDGDGVNDTEDACPETPGVAQPAPHNGCPIAKLEKKQKRITITQQIQFDTGKATIRPVSEPILKELASVMRQHPELTLIEVQGHTDSRGSRKLNTRLSFERAKSVVDWLVQHGIDDSRLRAKGYGPDRPIGSNATAEGRLQNRRVEFRILKGPGVDDEGKGAKP
ncbi:MAG: OmpA family protein [Myxococcales bacterium]|jgi:outer membrane protein OmpA-like peptidoglycan-associated protein